MRTWPRRGGAGGAAGSEVVQEQITRVLLERLIANKPHPWGALITFVELVRNPRFGFWSRGFVLHAAPEIRRVLEQLTRNVSGGAGPSTTTTTTAAHHQAALTSAGGDGEPRGGDYEV